MNNLTFTGTGEIPHRLWFRSETDPGVPYVAWDTPRASSTQMRGHPAAYEASQALVEAVNTALILEKPLLVTGRPGTGKTELAERIAYEFDLGAVLRFEAQSLSEANDLFYRFDYVGQLMVAKLAESARATPEEAAAINFVDFGPLGQAILRSAPQTYAGLLDRAGGAPQASRQPRRSVVLIDEIDKASRDFPNDLLNGIDRMEFRIRELGGKAGAPLVKGAERGSGYHPIVVITSNSERDLPPPFMRRCVYVHIEDPGREQLAAIVRKRVFGNGATPPAGQDGLAPLYSRLLDAFMELRDDGELRYQVGTSELLDLSVAARRVGIEGHDLSPGIVRRLTQAVSAIAKHPDDAQLIRDRLEALGASGSSM